MRITPQKDSYEVGEEIKCTAEAVQGLPQPLILWHDSKGEAYAIGTLVPSNNQVGINTYNCVATILLERAENTSLAESWSTTRLNNTFSKSLTLTFKVAGMY